MDKINILGTYIDPLSIDECLIKIKEAILSDGAMRIITANPELIYKAEKDSNLRKLTNKANLVLPDGVGVVWAARKLGGLTIERVTGVDLTYRILEEGQKNKWRIFLLGAKPGIGEEAVLKQHKRYPDIKWGFHHGYFTERNELSVVAQIKDFQPDVLLVGLGAPRQELWNDKYQGLAKVAIGVGGTIDVLAGVVQRAPVFYQKHNIEWLYRLGQEPSRLKRQLVLPLYVWSVLKEKYRT